MAEFEVFGKRTFANSAEQNYQQQYAYFKAGNSKIAYNSANLAEDEGYWLWNDAFYNAPLEDLRHIAKLIGLKA